jgi:hypothetical protein
MPDDTLWAPESAQEPRLPNRVARRDPCRCGVVKPAQQPPDLNQSLIAPRVRMHELSLDIAEHFAAIRANARAKDTGRPRETDTLQMY